jgi:hypothetical protein
VLLRITRVILNRPLSTTTRRRCFRVRYTLSGKVADSFYTPKDSALFILTGESIPPAPRLTSSAFLPSGAQVALTFDGATDNAGLAGTFPCSQLLAFVGAPAAACTWANATTITITLQATATLMPGGNITLLTGKVGPGEGALESSILGFRLSTRKESNEHASESA